MKETQLAFVFFPVLFAVLFSLSFFWLRGNYYKRDVEQTRAEAIRRGYAEYVVNPTNMDTKFVWKTNVVNQLGE